MNTTYSHHLKRAAWKAFALKGALHIALSDLFLEYDGILCNNMDNCLILSEVL